MNTKYLLFVPLFFVMTISVSAGAMSTPPRKGPDSGEAPGAPARKKPASRMNPELLLARQLSLAAKDNKIDEVRALLAQGVDVNVVNARGATALYYAVLHEHTEMVRFLLEYGANPNSAPVGDDTLLSLAIGLNSIPMATLLLEHGAHPDWQDGVGLTALMYAAIDPSGRELVKLLLKYKANPNLQDEGGNTALMHAIVHNHRDSVELFLEAGANVNIANRKGKTALFLAAGNDDMFAYLLEFKRQTRLGLRRPKKD